MHNTTCLMLCHGLPDMSHWWRVNVIMGFKNAVSIQCGHAWQLVFGKGVLVMSCSAFCAMAGMQALAILKCSGAVTDNLQSLRQTSLRTQLLL